LKEIEELECFSVKHQFFKGGENIKDKEEITMIDKAFVCVLL